MLYVGHCKVERNQTAAETSRTRHTYPTRWPDRKAILHTLVQEGGVGTSSVYSLVWLPNLAA